MRIGSLPPDEEDAHAQADWLLSAGVVGDRDLIVSAIMAAIRHERDACVSRLHEKANEYDHQRDPGMANHCRMLARMISDRT